MCLLDPNNIKFRSIQFYESCINYDFNEKLNYLELTHVNMLEVHLKTVHKERVVQENFQLNTRVRH